MRFLYVVVAVACTAFAALAVTPDPKPIWTPPAPVARQPSFTTIPPGYHAHTTTDGRTIVHHDSNRGSADAHEGIDRPWNKSGYAGQTVNVGESARAANCPGGVCPTGGVRGRFLSIAAPTSYSTTSYSASSRVTERSGTGPLRRLFGRLFRGR